MSAATTSLFPFSMFWPHYLGFCVFVMIVLAVDLGVFHKDAHKVSFKESAIWSVIWVGLSLLFNLGFYFFSRWHFETHPDLLPPGVLPEVLAHQVSLEFLTGYLIEKALSVDNLFVFAVVFSFFGIPQKYQHRVLFFGILGAIVFRGIFIALGSVLMQYHIVVYILGGFLIFTGLKMVFTKDEPMDPSSNAITRWMSRVLPVTADFHEQKFLVKIKSKWMVTPLFVALMFIEMTDVVFALDSVPAIFAITKEPLIVFTSNMFAILGLRALYFMLADIFRQISFAQIWPSFRLDFRRCKNGLLEQSVS